MENIEQNRGTRVLLQHEYGELVKKIAEQVQGLPTSGIPVPHIPIVGKNYDDCAYKIAFVGMETKGWPPKTSKLLVKDDFPTFCDLAKNAPEEATTRYENWLNENGMFEYREKSAYWLFIKHFLQQFYKIKNLKIEKGKYHSIMSSFVWGNANAIERYEVTAKQKHVDKKVWQAVKKASRPFDSINHLIDATHPKVVIITYKAVDTTYITAGNDVQSEKHFFSLPNGQKRAIRHYYLRNRDVHVFVTPHPTWMIRSKTGFKPYIKALIDPTQDIWQLPQNEYDWKKKPTDV